MTLKTQRDETRDEDSTRDLFCKMADESAMMDLNFEEYFAAGDVDWYDDLVEMHDAGQPMLDERSGDFLVISDADPLRAYVERSNAHWMQIPLPVEAAPVGGSPLATLTDDELLTMNVGTLVHIAQTAANGGLQVISPSQTPMATLMARTKHSRRTADMHITGSVASRVAQWPLVRGSLPSNLFPDTPIEPSADTPSVRRKTRTLSLAPPATEMVDPLVTAFIKARAMLDLQSRPDVCGDVRSLVDVLATAWDVGTSQIMDLPDVSLAPTGDLLRYAARADRVLPRVHAAVNERMCVSTGAPAIGRLVYGQHAAVDWRRARVVCEATFFMSTRAEGNSLYKMAGKSRPGDPSADPMRPNVVQMRPRPGCVWSCDPRSFALRPMVTVRRDRDKPLPARVVAAMTTYEDHVRPISAAIAAGASVSLTRASVMTNVNVTAESLVRGYLTVATSHLAATPRGKTAAATVRNALYQCITGAPTNSSIKLVSTAAALGPGADDRALRSSIGAPAYMRLGRLFQSIATTMRTELSVEAARRGDTLADWWNDMRAQLPLDLQVMDESSQSWASAAMWCLVNAPSARWSALEFALSKAQLRSLTTRGIASARLPIVRRSPARIAAAVKARLGEISKTFSARFYAVSDAAVALEEIATIRGHTTSVSVYAIAAAQWRIRAEQMRTLMLVRGSGPYTLVLDKEEWRLTTDPSRAYTSCRHILQSAKGVQQSVVTMLPNHISHTVSNTLLESASCVFPNVTPYASRMLRYVCDLHRLAGDMERNMSEVLTDLLETLTRYSTESSEPGLTAPVVSMAGTFRGGNPFANFAGNATSYWTLLGDMGDEAELFDNAVQLLGEDVYAQITDGTYANVAAMVDAFRAASGVASRHEDRARETVR